MNTRSSDIIIVRSAVDKASNKSTLVGGKRMDDIDAKISPTVVSGTNRLHNNSHDPADDDDYRAARFKGKLVGLDRMLINRSLSKLEDTFLVDSSIKLAVKDFKGRSYFHKGQPLNVVNEETGESYDDGCAIAWCKESFTLLDKQGNTIAKCFDSAEKDACVVYGTCPVSTYDKPFQEDTTSLYRWIQVRFQLDRCTIDLCSDDFYTPLWYIDNVTKKDLISVASVESHATIAWISKNTNWFVKSRRGLDPAVFICLAAVIMRFSDEATPDKKTVPVRRTKSAGSAESPEQRGSGAPRSKSFASSRDDMTMNTHSLAPRNRLVKNRREAVKASLTKGQAKVRAGSTMAFKVVKGVVVLPFRTASLTSERSNRRFNVQDDNIWVGPEEIIKNRYLSKKDDNRNLKITEDHHLTLAREDMRSCLQTEQRVHVKNASNRKPYDGGSDVKLKTKSFSLFDSDGASVAKCLEDLANQTSLILGTSPLFESDRKRKQKNSNSRIAKYFPWLQVKINEYDMSIEIWSGHTYTPLWFCENIRECISNSNQVDIISSENDEKVGQILTGTRWDIKAFAGIDPSILTCVAVILMRFNIGHYNGRGDEVRRNSSKVFQVVNGEVLAPFQDDCMDSDSEEEEYTTMPKLMPSLGIWVGPDEVINNRSLSANADKKIIQSHDRPTIKIAFNEDPICCVQAGAITNVVDSKTGENYQGGATIKWNTSSFELLDYRGIDVANCLEDKANLTSLVCGTTPLFLTDESIESMSTDNIEYYPWLQVKLECGVLVVDMWSGHGYTELWFCEDVMKEGLHDILSSEFNCPIGTICNGSGFESQPNIGIDPAIFACLSAVVCRFVQDKR